MPMVQANSFSLISNQTIYSCVTNIIKDFLIRKFPKDFFKYIYMRNSSAAITEQYLNYEDRLVKPKPSLAIGLSFESNDTTFNGDPHHFGITHVRQYAFEKGAMYDGIFKDYNNDIYVSAFRTRTKIIYEIGIKVESELKASNVEGYIRSLIGINKPFYLNNTFIEIPLPNTLIKFIAAKRNLDITNDVGINSLINYLKNNSANSISYKKHLTNGKNHFFYKYSTNLLCKISDKISFNKSLKEKSISDCIVSFNFEVELGSYLNFIYEALTNDLTPPPVYTNDVEDSSLELIYNYTIQTIIPRTYEGLTILHNISVLTSDTEEDVTNVSNVISKKVNDFRDYCMEEGILNDNLKLLIFRESTLISPVNYTIDWNTFNVTLINPFTNYTYTLVFYIHEENFTKFINMQENLRNNITPPNIINDI
jgi:hypothetical protein